MTKIRLKNLNRRQLQYIMVKKSLSENSRNKVLAAIAVKENMSVTEIARFFKVSRQTIYSWLNTPKDMIIHPEIHHKPMGRPAKWTKSMDRLLDRCLQKKPFELHLPALNWTIPVLIRFFVQKTGIKFSHSTLQRKLHAHSLRWKRPRYRLKPDPELLKKSGVFALE